MSSHTTHITRSCGRKTSFSELFSQARKYSASSWCQQHRYCHGCAGRNFGPERRRALCRHKSYPTLLYRRHGNVSIFSFLPHNMTSSDLVRSAGPIVPSRGVPIRCSYRDGHPQSVVGSGWDHCTRGLTLDCLGETLRLRGKRILLDSAGRLQLCDTC